MLNIIVLAGGGPRTEPWFLLLIPLLAILAVIKCVELTGQYLKKRRLVQENKLIDDLTIPFEETPNSN